MRVARTGRFPFLGMFGQTALLISVALLVAQAIGFFLLVNERDRWRFVDAVQPAIEKYAAAARDVAAAPAARRVEVAFRVSRFDQPFMLFPNSEVAFQHLKRQRDLEEKLKDVLDRAGVRVLAIEASSVGFADSPQGNGLLRSAFPMLPPNLFSASRSLNGLPPPPDGRNGAFGPEWNRRPTTGFPPLRPPPDENRQEIYLSARLPNGAWLNSHVFSMRPPAYFLSRLIAAEFVLFAVVLASSLFLAARLARPLAKLASASERIGPNQPIEPVPVKGPRDVRAAILSFNAMASRVTDLLHEKDRMLGAIGHDLRTPLASLRIRVETVEPVAERERIIETLDEMTKNDRRYFGSCAFGTTERAVCARRSVGARRFRCRGVPRTRPRCDISGFAARRAQTPVRPREAVGAQSHRKCRQVRRAGTRPRRYGGQCHTPGRPG